MRRWLEAVMTTISSWSGNATGSVLGALQSASPTNYREDIKSWWCTPVTSAWRTQRHKDHCRFVASRGFIARHYPGKEKRWGSGCRTDGWKVESPYCLYRGPKFSFQHIFGWLTTIFNSRGSNTLSRPLCAQKHMWQTHTHTYKNKNKTEEQWERKLRS